MDVSIFWKFAYTFDGTEQLDAEKLVSCLRILPKKFEDVFRKNFSWPIKPEKILKIKMDKLET